MTLRSLVLRMVMVAAVAATSGELFARFGSRDAGAAGLFQPIADAPTELNRFGGLDLGPARVGTPDWFADEPPPPASGPPPTTFPHLDARAADPAILSITGLNFPRVYNRALVTTSICENGTRSFYSRLPHELFVFEPRAGEPEPGYRFYPHSRYPSGLRTNSLGYRSPEITPSREAGVVRVAFVGASTVIGHPRAALVSPDYVMHWLSRWARESGRGVRFDYVNAAREGIGTRQYTEVVRREIALLKPDVVIGWGFESFDFAAFVELPPGITAGRPPRRDWVSVAAAATGTTWLAENSALLRLLTAMASRPFDADGVAREPVKPSYQRRFPDDFSSPNPSLGPSSPVPVAAAYADLDAFIGAVRALGAVPILIANQYAAYDGAVVEADRSTRDPILYATLGGVYGYLNESRWPLTYADQRGILEYQTRLFRGLARQRDVAFIDLLTDRHLDPALFLDGPHLTPLGMKLTAWWMFQDIAPAIEAMLAAWPRRAQPVAADDLAYLQQEPRQIAPSAVDCTPAGAADEVTGAYRLSSITAAALGAEVEPGEVPVVRTSTAPAGYAASITLDRAVAGDLTGKGWIKIGLKVLEGRVSVGALDKTATKFLTVRSLEASAGVQDLFLVVDDLAGLGNLMISNHRDGDAARSTVEVHRVELRRFR